MDVLIKYSDQFVSGFWVTFQLCLLSAIGALVVGTAVAVLRISPVPPLRAVGTAYVTVFRNMPLTIVMFFCAFALPTIGVNGNFLKIPLLDQLFRRLGTDLPFFRLAVIALTLYTAAFVCEALRAGINAVPAGQAEAARSLGLTFTQNLRHVVLPQAWKAAIVPLGSVIIAMIKNSALAGFFGVVGDLSSVADRLTGAGGEPIIPVFIGISIGYLIMTIPLGLLLDRIEKRRAVAR
ncbi:amino acid ABC transporter permease [Longispora albida]|uniref:amino acid ABC transporter permease n=1 Tax=Longispora albida TaxID=203523 RepID=UPI00037D8B47|nr:amino acid ABC transporter permease [Longispora albida]